MLFRKKISASLLVSLIFFCNNVSAAIMPVSDEIQVNSFASGNQYSPEVASNNLGEYIIAYSENSNGVNKGYIKRYNSSGSLINTSIYNGGTSRFAIGDIAINDSGTSVVVFAVGQNAALQIFDQQGNPTFTNLIQLNANDGLAYSGVSVSINNSGEAIVAWASHNKTYLRQLHTDGYWMSNSILVDSPLPFTSNVGIDAAGDFMIAWAHAATSTVRVYSKHFYTGGIVKKNTRLVNSSPASVTRVQGDPQVAINSTTGESVITWSNLSTDNAWHIYARKLKNNGQFDGSAFKVSQTRSVWEPLHGTVYNDSGITTAWNIRNNSDGHILATSYYSNGIIKSPETRLSFYTGGVQSDPEVGILSNNQLVVAWKSNLQDGDGTGIFSRKYID